MIRQYIGSYVIAMNREYIHNYILSYNDASAEEAVRKYYQKINTNMKDLNFTLNLKKQILSNELEYPEYSELIYNIDRLDIDLKEFFRYINDFNLEDDSACFFLTFTIYNIDCIVDGVYFYDIYKNNIHMIKRLDEELLSIYENNLNFNIVISMFCDIKKAVFFWNEFGLIKSALQIGRLTQYISSYDKIVFQKKDEKFNKQSYAHALGINLYNQLLIDNIDILIRGNNNDS